MSIATIKTNIKTNLDALVTAGTLGGATTTDLKKDPLAMDIPTHPHAFLMPPSTESDVNDNRSVIRTHSFDIMVIVNAENITGTSDVEQMIEAILSKFDNDPTLGGSALGGVLPVSSAPYPTQHGTKDVVIAVIQLKAKEIVSLTFA